MIRMKNFSEEWTHSYIDREVYVGTTFDIFYNPSTREWKEIYNQSRRLKVPVRFSFVYPANIVYVGAVPFHAELTERARKDFGQEQRGRIEGVIDPIKEEYYKKVDKKTTEESLEVFYNTILYKRVLSSYKEVNEFQLGTMAGQIE